MVTGPSRPEGNSAMFGAMLDTLVLVRRMAGGKAASPMRRLGQRLITSISSRLPCSLTASAISTRQGAVQTTPRSRPLRRTRAMFLTVPRSR
jgi:hypothetical protein